MLQSSKTIRIKKIKAYSINFGSAAVFQKMPRRNMWKNAAAMARGSKTMSAAFGIFAVGISLFSAYELGKEKE